MSERESGWLIETASGLYWTGRELMSSSFDKDPNNAVRFARLEDAEIVRCWLLEEHGGWAMKSTEHIFLGDDA
jgi:hypothetical protein